MLTLYRLAVLQLIAIQYSITKAVGVNRVIVNIDMARFRAVFKTFYRRGKGSVGLPYAGYHVTRSGRCQHIYNLLALPRVVTYTQYTHIAVKPQHVVYYLAVVYYVALCQY